MPLRSRAAARVWLLVCLPLLRGDGAPTDAPCSVTTAACFPDRREIEATATPPGAPPRRLKTLVRASGDLAARRFRATACPRPANFSGRPLFRAGRSPRAYRVRACEARPRAPILPHFRTPHEAPLVNRTPSG